ncbi:hypothetical protein FR943_19725 [Mycobacterium sp. TNTM28]|uniref:XRE family transcriptional regulator n=1 Tax=[Mycobacterium] fortunisiensis TaxID=2600579 RepID=A0ABS6KQY0_9MYCO|nr:hypothetical protein [[Mycobacterium] fortunisiensis]MBU9766062.1 hypothetical protein [[Mycobacterium] fortunisiensis]
MSKQIDIIRLTSAKDDKSILVDEQQVAFSELVPQIKELNPGANDVVMVAALEAGTAGQLTQLLQLVTSEKIQTENLVNAMFTRRTVSVQAAQQAQRNADARQELIDEFGLYSGERVADLSGSRARNRFATASRWLAEGRIFAVEHLGARAYPAFQFGTDGNPRPVIQRVLKVLEPYGLDGWETALWFTSRTGWLDDRRPVDLLVGAADDVVVAAGHAFDGVGV